MVLFLRNKRFNFMLFWADYYLRWWRLPIEESTCLKTDLGGGDYYLRYSGLPPSVISTSWRPLDEIHRFNCSRWGSVPHRLPHPNWASEENINKKWGGGGQDSFIGSLKMPFNFEYLHFWKVKLFQSSYWIFENRVSQKKWV